MTSHKFPTMILFVLDSVQCCTKTYLQLVGCWADTAITVVATVGHMHEATARTIDQLNCV